MLENETNILKSQKQTPAQRATQSTSTATSTIPPSIGPPKRKETTDSPHVKATLRWPFQALLKLARKKLGQKLPVVVKSGKQLCQPCQKSSQKNEE